MKTSSLLNKLFLFTFTCFVLSGCTINSEKTIDSSNSLNWIDEFIEVQENSDSENVYTFVCESIMKKPETVTIACADFGEEVLDIKWTTWGARGAKGIGIHSVNDCLPDCADGTRVTTPVYLWLKGTTTDGKSFYLNNLFIVPKVAYDNESSASGKKDSQFTEEFSLENRNLHGQQWNLAEFWKSNPKLRGNIPE